MSSNSVGCDRPALGSGSPPGPLPHCHVPGGYHEACERDPQPQDSASPNRTRATAAYEIRVAAAEYEFNQQDPLHPCNGDEDRYSHSCFYASYSKGLKHNLFGEPIPNDYQKLLRALSTGDPNDFEKIDLGLPSSQNPRKLGNPQAALAYELIGADSHQIYIWKNASGNPVPCDCVGTHPVAFPPAPEFRSSIEIGEIAENYWMALTRDVAFVDYGTGKNTDFDSTTSGSITQAAAADLSQFGDFGQPNPGAVTWQTLFRGFMPDDLVGPYVSQFLLRDVPYGAQSVSARIATVLPSVDYLTDPDEWLAVQNGKDEDQLACDPRRRYVRSGRDLGQFVHVDRDFTAFINAAKILLAGKTPSRCEAIGGFGIDLADGLPYNNPEVLPGDPDFNPKGPFGGNKKSRNQEGVATFGDRHVLELLLEVMNRGLRAAWYEKWSVHRRLRPEEFGGRIHFHLTAGRNYEFDPAAFANLQSNVLNRVNNKYGSYLLPMAYAEGCPLFPAYPQGHATVAGAAITLLKAFFKDEPFIKAGTGRQPMVAHRNGQKLLPYTGSDRNKMTIHGELNKLASNIPLARDFAGVHWRSDYSEGLRLGEQVTVRLLQDISCTFTEPFSFAFKSFDGYTIQIDKPAACPTLSFTSPNPAC